MLGRIVYLFLCFTFLSAVDDEYSSNAQSLHPDSVMLRIEKFGHYLLYRNHDTTFISNHSDKFIVKLIGVNKFNYFKLKDSKNNSSARYRPDRKLNLGFGIAYKWFAVDLAFNVGIGEDSDFENSRYLDLSGTIFSSKQFISASYQYYFGYQMNKFTGITSEELPASPYRDDIRSRFFGLQYFFAFNYDKFSLKAPFIHNEVQKKSAGSFLLGAGFGIYTLDADSTIIPTEFYNDFDEKLHITDLSATTVSINYGYMYSFIWQKHFYATVSLMPGLGINFGDYKTDYRELYKTHLYLGLKTMNSLGYNSDNFFGGLQFSSDLFKTRIDKRLNVITGHGKAKLFLGWRFK